MPRLIDPALFSGAYLQDLGDGVRLTVWEKGADGVRSPRVLEGDEASDAATEIRDMLAGTSEPDEDAPTTPRRKGKR